MADLTLASHNETLYRQRRSPSFDYRALKKYEHSAKAS
jgi:hypothetical protein